jgi:hypothetical protein
MINSFNDYTTVLTLRNATAVVGQAGLIECALNVFVTAEAVPIVVVNIFLIFIKGRE